MVELSVIIPAYNEAADIEQTVRQVTQKLNALNIRHEIICVNDGSTDNTLTCMQKLANNNIHVLTYPMNRGKGYAVRLGMRQAQGQYHVFMDADLSTSLEAIEPFIQCMRRNEYDIILGNRHSTEQLRQQHQPFHRKVLGRIFIILSCLCVGRMIKDFNCGFKMFNAAASQLLFNQQRIDNWAFDTEIIYIATLNRLRIGEIPVVWNHHPSSNVRAWRDVFTSLGDLLRIKLNGLTCCYSRK